MAVTAYGSDLVLAATTAVLKNVLENGMVDRGVIANVGASAVVTAQPPDRIEIGAEEKAQLNLFLYQVKPKGMEYGNRAVPSDGSRWASPAPVFELSYLISAYGGEDFQSEVLLGFVVESFARNPVIGEDVIIPALATAGKGRPVVPGLGAIKEVGLDKRMREIRLTLQALTPDEMFNIWSTLQSTYRLSVVYRASVFVDGRDEDVPAGK